MGCGLPVGADSSAIGLPPCPPHPRHPVGRVKPALSWYTPSSGCTRPTAARRRRLVPSVARPNVAWFGSVALGFVPQPNLRGSEFPGSTAWWMKRASSTLQKLSAAGHGKRAAVGRMQPAKAFLSDFQTPEMKKERRLWRCSFARRPWMAGRAACWKRRQADHREPWVPTSLLRRRAPGAEAPGWNGWRARCSPGPPAISRWSSGWRCRRPLRC